MSYHNELGKLGEHLAIAYLKKQGYTILKHNYYFQKAELDIVAQKKKTLVIVEVKTRNSSFFGDPQSFVSASKIKLMVKAAEHFLLENELELEVRFDIIAIIKNKTQEELTHIPDAFYFF